MSKWPKDNQPALIKFYGDPASQVGSQLVRVTPPFKMYYDGKLIKTLSFHTKAASALLSALNKIWDYYGHDQAVIDKLGLSDYAGSYNPRMVRGSKTKWSNHAYAAAIDLDADRNGFNTGKGVMPFPAVAAFKSEGARWGGDYKSRTDPMHFEFCDGGEPERSFAQWLQHYGCNPMAAHRLIVEPELAEAAIPHNTESISIEVVQQRLDDFGYHEVGDIDGKWGGKTAGAIAAFSNDRHLVGSEGITPELIKEMDKAKAEGWKRSIAPSRALATVAELKEEAPEIIPAEQNKVVGTVAAGATSLTLMSQVADSADKSSSLLSQFSGIVDLIPKWAYLVTILALIGFFTWNSWRSSKRIAAAYKTGERN